MPRQLKAVVVAVGGERVVLELEDGERREVAAPDHIEVAVGMTVRMIDTGDDAPIFAWGV